MSSMGIIITEMLEIYDIDASGTIGEDEFRRMLEYPPWTALYPPSIPNEVRTSAACLD